mgnify:CR=1 FL=1
MKFEECKVGDIVIPKTGVIETISATDKNNHWTPRTKKFFIVILNHITKTVMIKTTDPLIPEGYDFVDPSCLNRADFHKIPMPDTLQDKEAIEQPVDFKVVSSPSQLSAYYKGKKIAVVDHNNYDEEFELNLLLRRACLKLKNEHTIVKTVEELL